MLALSRQINYLRPLGCGLLFTVLFSQAALVRAERPTATRLLPQKTLFYARIPDIHQLQERFKDTALAKMSQDPKLAPLVKQVYGAVGTAWSELKTQIDVPLDELLAIPQGEILLALVDQQDGQPALVAMIDVKDHLPSAQKVLDRAAAELDKRDAPRTEETIGDLKMTVYQVERRRGTQLAFGVKDGTVVIATATGPLKSIVARWNGEKPAKDDPQGVITDNPSFAAMMRSVKAEHDADVQAAAFIDPIATVSAYTRGNAGASLALAALPVLGLDGLKGLGGSIAFGQGEFDMVVHGHILLQQPRAGVIDMIQLEPGTYAPERWVPGDAASYMTMHWDLAETYTKGGKLFDSLQGEGAFARVVKERISDYVGVEFEHELIAATEGRISHITYVMKPVSLNSRGSLFAFKLKDPDAFQKTMIVIAEKQAAIMENATYAGVKYYKFKVPPAPENQPQPTPCVGIFDGYLMVSDRTALLEKIFSSPLDPAKSLAAELEYKLIFSKILKHAGGAKPSLIAFDRPEEGMRLMYELSGADSIRDRMKNADNPLFKNLNKALEDNPLPPFEVIAKYLAPSGGVLLNDETGLHYTGFTLRRGN